MLPDVSSSETDIIKKDVFDLDVTEFFDSNIQREYNGIKVRSHIFYCERCNKIIVMPPWFSTFFANKDRDPRAFIEKHLTCCNDPQVLFLIPTGRLTPVQKKYCGSFIPSTYKSTIQIWYVPDGYVTSLIVSEELL